MPLDDSQLLTTPANSVLAKVTLRLKWEDDETYGLLRKNKGLDTLDIEVKCDGEPQKDVSVGGCDKNFTFDINNKPKDETIQALSKEDAKDKIENSIIGDNTAIFELTAVITIGEKFPRIIKKLKDGGDDFDIIATYTYYTFDIDDSGSSNDDNTNDDNKKTGDIDYGHQIGEYYISLCYGRSMI